VAVFFAKELETVATYWRIYRKDGVTLGFTSHDRALELEGVRHLAAPGIIPSAIRLTDSITPDSAEVEGALSHDLISSIDLQAGAYDGAQIVIGAIDWQSLEFAQIYTGTIGDIEQDGLRFAAELRSSKYMLEADLVPRTSPTCRAEFCDKSCGLSAEAFGQNVTTDAVDPDANTVTITGFNPALFEQGTLRFCEGPQIGILFGITEASTNSLLLDRPIANDTPQQVAVKLRQGCDRTFTTCRTRFANAINFRGEPFLPGNDLLARYPRPQ
jgi:uncharacterized phage protein (TIGR02218 family)